jgi:DNA-binding NarL/FixJ family response regulator
MSNRMGLGPRAARVLIIDDHPIVREGLALRLGGQSDLSVCGEASNIREALSLLETTDPDIAVVDISLGVDDGLDLIVRMKARGFRTAILVWSMYPETLYAERALHAGAMGYISKDEATSRIIAAIRCVLSGRVYLSESMIDRMVRRRSLGAADSAGSPVDCLSARELQVFRLLGTGLTTSEIATQLSRSIHTIETHRQRIKEKLALSSGAELIQVATRWAANLSPSY